MLDYGTGIYVVFLYHINPIVVNKQDEYIELVQGSIAARSLKAS